MMQFHHVPIMLPEVMELLRPERGGLFVDGTLGGGGHSEGILSRLGNGRLYGIDRDGNAIAAASARLAPFGDKFKAIRGNFFDMKELLAAEGVSGVDGILLDLGVSSHQLDTPQRGFSYHEDAPLDMRMDDRAALSAYDVVNGYSVEELAGIIRDYGEERYAFRVANSIVREREKQPINSTVQLAEIIKSAIPAANRREGPHPARRTFQAIRIEVNGELAELGQAIENAHDLLNPGGVLAVITFHSLEDRIVKIEFERRLNPCTCPKEFPVCVCGKVADVKRVTKKPIVPGREETESNPRARSAKLRVLEKL